MNLLARSGATVFAAFVALCAPSGLGAAAQAATAKARIGRSAEAQLRPIGTSRVNGVIAFQEVAISATSQQTTRAKVSICASIS
jgi:hypothetical protein